MRLSRKTIYMAAGLCLALVLLLVSQLSPRISALTHEMVRIAGNTPAALNDAIFVEHSDKATQMDVVMGLKLRHQDKLNQLLVDQLDPTSPQYHQFLTPEQFLEQFGPREDAMERMTRLMKQNDIDVLEPSSNGLLLHVRGTVGQMEELFNVHINDYKVNNQLLFSNDNDPILPADMAALVSTISGLNNMDVYHENRASRRQLSAEDMLSFGYGPDAIATAYNFPNANNKLPGPKYSGKGVSIAIPSAFTYSSADVEEYWRQYGIERTGTVNDVYVNGPTAELNSETTMDLQQVGAQAPGADITMYLAKDATAKSFTLIFNQIVTDNKVSIASYSWGSCERTRTSNRMNTDHALFLQAAAQGIAIFVASGDDGAYGCPSKTADPSVFYPGSDPAITAVGGTTLLLNADGSRLSETAWAGSGGGISSHFERPLWQFGPSVPNNSYRNNSDVSLNSDGYSGYTMFYKGAWYKGGGTSFGAPVWAALWGLASEAGATTTRLGLATPTIYRLARSPDYAKAFYDVQSGDNGNRKGPGYSAGPAWDYPTGWGSPNGVNLVEWLLADQATARSPDQPPGFDLPPG